MGFHAPQELARILGETIDFARQGQLAADRARSYYRDETRLRIALMSHETSDALVFFGATGDLAYKKIFPALQALAKRGHLDIPVIGVAKAGWTLDQLKRSGRATASERHGRS